MPLARADPDAFVTSLAAAVLPVGGWAVYGAAHTGYNLLETGFDHPEFDRLQSASLQFLRERGVPKSRVTGDEWQFWLSHQGKTEPWLVGAQAPRPEQRD